MKGTFTQSVFFTLLHASLALLSGLLLWLAAATSDIYIPPICFTIILLVTGIFSFILYLVFRRFLLRKLQQVYCAFAKETFKRMAYPTLSVVALFCSALVQAQVSGTVFKDFNANGTKQNTAAFTEPGQDGVVVNAYDPAGSTLTVSYTGGGASTNNTGGYSVTGGTLSQIRLEFILPDTYTFASNGATGGTTVMFPTGATQDLAVNYPQDYTQANPQVLLPNYVGGTLNGLAATDASIFRFNYYGNDKYIGQPGYVAPIKVAEHQFLGGTYGTAYSKVTKKCFAAAVLRRHVVFGPLGIGGIYEIDPITGTTTNWLDIETLSGIDAGTDTRNAGDPANSIPPDPNDNSYDVLAFPLIGKTSLGDLEISDDGKTLFVVNAFQQSLVVINTANQTLSGSYPINAATLGLTCPQSDFRPWGLNYYKGKVYVGVVCTAQSTNNPADMMAYVLQFDPANPGAGFTIFFSLSLNYTRESINWQPWNENSYDPGGGGENARNPQAILSDIEFDVDGSMLLGFLDRHVMMFGSFNAPPDPTASSNSSATAFPHGDMLRVCKTGGTLVLEGSAGCSYNFTYSGGGEFYDDQRQGGNGNGNIKEVFGGSMILFPGTGEILSNAIDEFDVNENGVGWWNNTSGVRNRAYMLIDKDLESAFGKTAGLGDLELLSDAAPLEIGNRVWMDTDNDGIQDAGEMGIGSIPVKLYLGGVQVGATTTSSDGTFYFNNSTVNLNGATGLLPGTAYIIRVDAANFPVGKSLVTFQNVGGPGQPDVRDNDAGLVSGNAEIAVTTGNFGENNHTLDMAFRQCTTPAATFTPTPPTCTGATANNNGIITFATATDVTNFGLSTAGAATYNGPAYPATTFTAVGQNVSTTIPNTGGTYIVRVFNGAADCFTDVTVTVATINCACPTLPCGGTTVVKN